MNRRRKGLQPEFLSNPPEDALLLVRLEILYASTDRTNRVEIVRLRGAHVNVTNSKREEGILSFSRMEVAVPQGSLREAWSELGWSDFVPLIALAEESGRR